MIGRLGDLTRPLPRVRGYSVCAVGVQLSGEGVGSMGTSLRHTTYVTLSNEPPRTTASVVAASFITAMIFVNVVAVVLASVPSLFESYETTFVLIELVSAVVFTGEWFLRVWSCVERAEYSSLPAMRARLKYIVSPMSLVDIVAVVPLYLSVFDVVSAQSLIALRLLRLLQLVRFFGPLVVLWRVVKSEAPAMMGTIFIVVVLIVMAASGMYLVERNVQPEAFGSIPSAMWWAAVTLTTVGYGDVTPITPVGRVIGVAIMILGIGLVALPAGMLASRFSEELHNRREEFRHRVDLALHDGGFDEGELAALKAAQREYMLTDSSANQIIAEERKRVRRICQTCGKMILSS